MAPVIELVDVSKRYALEGVAVVALDRLSLKIEEGSVTGIVGRSGSGKSTLLNILGGLDRPTTGEVIVAGRTLSRRTSDELAAYRREAIGFVFQSFHLIAHMTALENVTLALALAGRGPLERRRRAFELLERVGLGARAKHRPRQMSGGEQQRVALARALANDPPVLLADEPTGSLDSKTADDVMSLLLKTAGELKRTVIIVTHEREMARRYCDRIIELGDGRILHDRMRPFTADGDVPEAVPEAAKAPDAPEPEAAA